MRSRLQGGILAKASRGELVLRLPVGFAYDPCDAVVLDPDEGVRQAIKHLFSTFEATGSATAVVKAFSAEGLTFPARHSSGPHAGELYWVRLRHDHVLFTLHNPRYAGCYFYGRNRCVTDIEGRHHTITKPREEWTVFLPGAHDGYITLEQFEANEARLAANAAARGDDRSAGPPREGPALLQGLVVCGRCGRRMTVNYHKRCNGTLVPDYSCQSKGIATGTAPCQSVCGSGVDEAVAELMLKELSPLGIEAALEVSAELVKRAKEADHVRAAVVERANYAAEAARRRYLAVDPSNRLVASTLEADWNHKLRELADAQDDYERAARGDAILPNDEQQERIRALASDLPALWHDPATPMRERKRLIRLLVTDVTLLKTDGRITAQVRLPGGACRTLDVPRPKRAWEGHATSKEVLSLIDEMLRDHTYDEAVKILNADGVRNGWGKSFTVPSLTWLCKAHNIPSLRQRLHAGGMLTLGEIAAELGVCTQTIKVWQRRGDITGRRIDGRDEYLYHPGQKRPPDGRSTRWRRRPETVTGDAHDAISVARRSISATTSTGGAV